MNDKTKHLRPMKHHLLSVVKGECKQSRSPFFGNCNDSWPSTSRFSDRNRSRPENCRVAAVRRKKSFGKKCFLMHSSSDHPCPCWRSYRSAMTSSSGVEMCDIYVNIDTITDTNINLNIEIIVLRNKHLVKCSNR